MIKCHSCRFENQLPLAIRREIYAVWCERCKDLTLKTRAPKDCCQFFKPVRERDRQIQQERQKQLEEMLEHRDQLHLQVEERKASQPWVDRRLVIWQVVDKNTEAYDLLVKLCRRLAENAESDKKKDWQNYSVLQVISIRISTVFTVLDQDIRQVNMLRKLLLSLGCTFKHDDKPFDLQTD
jgi:hypothetical protein